MANSATVASTTTATPGPFWFEFTNAANVALNASATNSGVTAVTIGLPTTGAGSLLVTNQALAVVALNQANIQGAVGTGLLAGTAIANCVVTNATTLTLSIVNSGAASNINANTRFIAYTVNGV